MTVYLILTVISDFNKLMEAGVNLVTTLGVGRLGIRIPAETKNISPPNIQTSSRAQTA